MFSRFKTNSAYKTKKRNMNPGFDNSIISIAEDFYLAYSRCREGKNGHLDERGIYCEECVNVPAIVNGAFAIELFLKSMTNKRGHSLKELFLSLDVNDQTAIRSEVEPHLFNDYSFEDALNVIDSAFLFWRYLHEKDNNGPGLNVTINILPEFLETIRKLAKNRWEENHKTKEQ